MSSKITKALFIAFHLLIVMSCNSESPDPQPEWGTFELAIKQNRSEGPDLRALVDDVTHLVITITKADGTPTDFMQKKLDVYISGDFFISEPIQLPVGDYVITSAYLINQDKAVVSASPQQGSPLAEHINGGLPISINVPGQGSGNPPSIIEIEAIPTVGHKPSDFGLNASEITFKELYHIYIGLVKKVGELDYLPGRLTITSGDYIHQQEMKEGINIISFSPGYTSYHLKAESPGRRTLERTFTLSALLAHKSNAMHIVLRD